MGFSAGAESISALGSMDIRAVLDGAWPTGPDAAGRDTGSGADGEDIRGQDIRGHYIEPYARLSTAPRDVAYRRAAPHLERSFAKPRPGCRCRGHVHDTDALGMRLQLRPTGDKGKDG